MLCCAVRYIHTRIGHGSEGGKKGRQHERKEVAKAIATYAFN